MRTIEPTQTSPEVPAGRPRRATWWIVAAVTVLIAGALTWWATSSDDDPDPGPTTTTTVDESPGTSSGASSTTTAAPAADPTAMWPAPGTGTLFATPEEAARSFAADFLGFRSPIVGEFRQGDTRSGEVPIRPKANGPETTVLVRQLSSTGGDDWSVLGATTEDITVDTPEPMSEIASPAKVTGSARAFEGTVQVEVREDGEPGPIGEGFVTGGGDVKRPFEGSIAFETPSEPYGTLVFFASSAENGEVWQATTVRVRLASTDAGAAACGTTVPQHLQPGEGQMEVTAWFSCDASGAADGAVTPVRRLVPTSPRVLQASLEALLAGPTAAEKQAGIGSRFSTATDDLLRGVTISDGHAVVDFDDLATVIPNASSSAGSRRLLAELDATVFQFPSVRTAEYRIEGSCENFNEWLQMGGCDPRTRPVSTD